MMRALSHCITEQSGHVSITVAFDRDAEIPIALTHDTLLPSTVIRRTITTFVTSIHSTVLQNHQIITLVQDYNYYSGQLNFPTDHIDTSIIMGQTVRSYMIYCVF